MGHPAWSENSTVRVHLRFEICSALKFIVTTMLMLKFILADYDIA